VLPRCVAETEVQAKDPSEPPKGRDPHLRVLVFSSSRGVLVFSCSRVLVFLCSCVLVFLCSCVLVFLCSCVLEFLPIACYQTKP
jgi:hypothetical protein